MISKVKGLHRFAFISNLNTVFSFVIKKLLYHILLIEINVIKLGNSVILFTYL